MAKKKSRAGRKITRTKLSATNKKPVTIFAAALVVVAVAVLIYIFYPGQAPKDPEKEYERGIALSLGLEFKNQGRLSFLTAGGDTAVTIAIELADSDITRRIGMMFREEMEELQGMLFIFPFEDIRSFWMRNTILPLDMIFINTKNEIVNIEKNTEPFAERSYFSTAPAKYVLEVNAGFADRYGLNDGQIVTWTDKEL